MSEKLEFFQQVKDTAAAKREKEKAKEVETSLKRVTRQIWKHAKKGCAYTRTEVPLFYQDTGMRVVQSLREQGFGVRYSWTGVSKNTSKARSLWTLILTIEWDHE